MARDQHVLLKILGGSAEGAHAREGLKRQRQRRKGYFSRLSKSTVA
jgi:hypothetical protein